MLKSLPKGTILLNSTTSPIWPYLPFIFKKATWAVIDLFFLLPHLTITSGYEYLGKTYKSKSININYLPADPDRKDNKDNITNGTKNQAVF